MDAGEGVCAGRGQSDDHRARVSGRRPTLSVCSWGHNNSHNRRLRPGQLWTFLRQSARDSLHDVLISDVRTAGRWLGGSVVWFDQGGDSVAGVSADRPLLQALISDWADAASRPGSVGRLEMEISDHD